MKIARSITELVGCTPLLELNNLKRELKFEGQIYAKLESFNPAASVKDRAAVAMVDASGLGSGAVIIEPTSGNTGVGLAMVAAARSMRLILTMPDSMSVERRALLCAMGAELVLTPAALGMQGAVDRALELQQQIEGSVILDQFANPANPAIHARTTAIEIWDDTMGDFDVFVAGIGTGGTVSGVGRAIKGRNPAIEVIGVEPLASPLLSGGVAGPHAIQGIGANFVPANLDRSVVDRVIGISNQDAIATMRLLARCEGVLAGISSGAAVAAAAQAATSKRRVVVILPDTGERYLSLGLFD